LVSGEKGQAKASFEQAASQDPQNPNIPIHAAVTALARNKPELAIELLRPASRRFSTNAAVYRVLGTAYYRVGDYRSSQVALRQALSLDKSNGLAYFLMGCTLAKLGQPKAADVQFERAAALSPRYQTLRR
jgi:Tfp pilus assembly protein PilF